MIMLTEVLAATPESGRSWPLIASTGAVVALLAVALWQGRELRSLRDAVTKLQEPPEPAPQVRTGRITKPMFTGLYAEPAPSPLSGLGALPGAPLLVVAAVLAAVALALGSPGGGPAQALELASRAQVDSLQAQLDSVSGRVRILGDSLQLAAAPAPRAASAVAKSGAERRMASRRSVIPPAPQILPAPAFPGTP